jgi:16S rRNA (guanine1207-N2)-methyltransferase
MVLVVAALCYHYPVDTKDVSKLKEDIRFHKTLAGVDMGFASTWGLFSPEKIDEGTDLLIQNLEIDENDVSLDLGCGYGPIGLFMAKKSNGGKAHLIDKDFVAIDFAKKNAGINNVSNIQIYLSNGFSNIPANLQFDNIVSNLPAKVSNEFYWILFNDAKKYLRPGGKFYVVTISGLKEFIKRNFKEVFGNYKKLAQNKTYTVAVAVKEKPGFD